MAEGHLERLARFLDRLEEDSGRRVRVAVEPEPGCVVETTTQAVERLACVDRTRVGVCVDTAHLAVAWEEPDEAVARLQGAGLEVVKAQLSSALHVEHPSEPATTAVLRGFDEDRYLHQVRPRGGAGWDDLGEAFAHADASAWRVHFHLPLGAEPLPPLASTHATLRESVRALVGGDRALTDHLDVETYTWTVLPDPPGGDDELVDGLAAELAWARDELVAAGLEVVS